MPYSYITYAQMRQQLAERLDDPNNIFWLDSENGVYCQEALRAWQSMTAYWRGRMQFSLVTGVSWYDATAQANTLVPLTLTNSNLTAQMCYHLIEPQLLGNAWVGTTQFSFDAILQALNRRRNQFLLETGIVQTIATIAAGSPPVSQVVLPDSYMDVRRAAWVDAATNAKTPLWREEDLDATAYMPLWSLTPVLVPFAYSISSVPPLTLGLTSPAAGPGSLEILSIQAPATLSNLPALMNIPDDLAWAVMWGALADLLMQEGEPHDAQRAQYGQRRYTEGVALGRFYSLIIQSYINSTPAMTNSVSEMDSLAPNWENATTGNTIVGTSGWNMLAISPIPTGGAVQLDVVQNAPIPVLDGDEIQIGREHLEAVLNYAQHIASFKQGGDEFADTVSLYEEFLRMARDYNAMLSAYIPEVQGIAMQSRKDDVAENTRRVAAQEA